MNKVDTDKLCLFLFFLWMSVAKLFTTTFWNNCYGLNRTYSELISSDVYCSLRDYPKSAFPLMTCINFKEKLIIVIKYPSQSELINNKIIKAFWAFFGRFCVPFSRLEHLYLQYLHSFWKILWSFLYARQSNFIPLARPSTCLDNEMVLLV